MTPATVIQFPEPRHVAIDRVLAEPVRRNPDTVSPEPEHIDAVLAEPAPARTTADAIRAIMEME